MSLAVVQSRAQVGVSAPRVAVEVHLSGGLPVITIVGLPEAAVRESRDRVRAAIVSGVAFATGAFFLYQAFVHAPFEIIAR
mgnify:CR=1 FL=1